ncbi:MAG: hypothetical protein M1831_005248 [Alyxoria varia]|nr:MAG: hypothetical protein M1831_005248 [Alyxoria varia]
MAPRKEKADKANADEGRTTYLIRSRNDYEISTQTKVAAATKTLKDLHERQKIEGRASGKQVVYHALQDPSVDASPETLKAMDAQITSVRNETNALHASMKSMRGQLNAFTNAVPLSEMQANIASLGKEEAALEERLESLKGGLAHPIMTTTEMDILEERERYWVNAVARRAKIRKELWGVVKDSLPEDASIEDVKVREASHAPYKDLQKQLTW